MKIKKLVAGIAAASIAVSAMTAVSASAITNGATSIDFEDGDTSFVYFNTDDNQGGTVTTESHGGSTQLKVTPAASNEALKLWFDLDKIMDRSTATQIKTIELDITCVSQDPEVAVGWVGGAIGTAGGFVQGGPDDQGQKNPGWSDASWDGGAYEVGEEATAHATKKFLIPMQMYSEDGTNPFFGVMKWASEVDYVMYIDNVVFKDENDNVLTIGVSAAAAEDENTDAEAADDAAPADDADEADDASDDVAVSDDADDNAAPAPAETSAPAATTTPAPATGNVPAAVMLSVMAVAGAAALVSKKRK